MFSISMILFGTVLSLTSWTQVLWKWWLGKSAGLLFSMTVFRRPRCRLWHWITSISVLFWILQNLLVFRSSYGLNFHQSLLFSLLAHYAPLATWPYDNPTDESHNITYSVNGRKHLNSTLRTTVINVRWNNSTQCFCRDSLFNSPSITVM